MCSRLINLLSYRLEVNRRKWKEIKSHKKRYCLCQIITSEWLKFFCVVFLHNGLTFCGLNRYIEAGNIDKTEASWLYKNTKAEQDRDSLIQAIVRLFRFFVGLILISISVLCWCMSWVFIGLTFVWCFKNDIDYGYVVSMETLLDERTRIEQEVFHSDNNNEGNEEDSLISFNEQREARLASIDYQIAELEMRNEHSNYRRCNTIETAIDLENQSYVNNLVGVAVPTVASYIENQSVQLASVVRCTSPKP